jgi:acetate kinase
VKILVLNTGSSSVKYRLFDDEITLAKGLIERIGEDGGDAPDHESALRRIMDELDLGELAAVGHRVVHGGSEFTRATVIDDAVVATIERLVPLAPLHNPPALAGISVARKLLPDLPQVAVFDTAFHSGIPPEGVTWAIDRELAERWQVRRYGFHGTSHAYVARQTAALLGRPVEQTNVITLHLGNGASACAVRGGRSVATSMGMSPQGGLVMGTRSGDIDPTVVFHLHRVAGMPIEDIERSLTREAGLLGLSGVNDMRTLLQRRAEGDPHAALAFDVYCRRLREYVGAYLAVLGRADAVTFTGGVGENAAPVRAATLAGLTPLGIEVDEERDRAGGTVISTDNSPIAVCVVPTDEELEIATQTRAALDG